MPNTQSCFQAWDAALPLQEEQPMQPDVALAVLQNQPGKKAIAVPSFRARLPSRWTLHMRAGFLHPEFYPWGPIMAELTATLQETRDPCSASLCPLPHSPWRVCKHCPVLISQIFTVESALPETRMLSRNSMPLVRDWCPIRVCKQLPLSASHTRIEVSREPLTMWVPSNCTMVRDKTLQTSSSEGLG